jgi:calcineurin-like phosphoesterase family protein
MKIKNVIFDKEKLFFTSDTHFFHKNIIKYCDRPFTSVEEMNEQIVENWNSVVPKDGVVFHLGDVSLTASPKALKSLLDRLNGTKYLIIGNHENDALSKQDIRETWAGIYDVAEIFIPDDEITYGEQHIVMCHYPMIVWNGSHRGSWQLFGHVHGGLSNKGVIKHPVTAMDAGVDSHNYYPISYQQVKEQITKQSLEGKASEVLPSHERA